MLSSLLRSSSVHQADPRSSPRAGTVEQVHTRCCTLTLTTAMVYLSISVRDYRQHTAEQTVFCRVPNTPQSQTQPARIQAKDSSQSKSVSLSCSLKNENYELGDQFLLTLFLPASLLPRTQASRIKVVPSRVTPINPKCAYFIFHLDGDSFFLSRAQHCTKHKAVMN